MNSVRFGFTPVPAMKEEDRHFLVDYFRERNQDLKRLMNIPLDRWQQ